MMLLEDEFVCLCRDYFNKYESETNPKFDKEPEEISQFLNKLLQKHQKIQITDEVRYYIPLLAQYKDGILCPILETCVEGISPIHFVPDLSLQVITNHDDKNNKKSKAPRRYKNKNNKAPNTTRNYTKNYFKEEYNTTDQCNHTFKNIEDVGNVPKITLPPHQTARNGPSSYRARRNLNTASQNRLYTATYKQPLPPLKDTQDNVLPSLYISDKQNFYMAQKTNKDSLDFNILPPDYPDQMINEDFAVLSPSGVIVMNGDRASVVDLDQFVSDIKNEYIVERSSFRQRYSYRFFYTWRERYRNRLFRKIIRSFDNKDAVCNVGFSQFLEKVRETVLTTTDPFLQIYSRGFDTPSHVGEKNNNDNNGRSPERKKKSSSNIKTNTPSGSPNTSNVSTSSTSSSNGDHTADFSDLIDVATESIEKIDEDVRLMGEDTCRQISEVFKQVRSANLLMQLDFEELNSLNSLPPSLQPFKSDLKWRVPSLYRQRLRENILLRERKLAGERQEYIRKFFNRIRSFYTGLLIVQCKQCLLNYLYRFSSRSPRLNHQLTGEKVKIRINKLVANFDSEKGMSVYPSRTLFLNWLDHTVAQITDAFISENKHINVDVIADIDPEYEFEVENPKAILSRYPDIKSLKNDALSNLNEVFDYVEHEISPHSNFLKNLKNLSDEAKTFESFRQCDLVQSMINNLINSKQSLSKRPKTIYHTLSENKETIDFVVDMKPSFEEAGNTLNDGIKIFQNNLISDLNLQFSEIQERWAILKDKTISKDECKEFETKLVLFSTLSDMLSSSWNETKSEISALVDTTMGFYRSLNEKCTFTTVESMEFFNRTCQKMGISSVLIDINRNKNKGKVELKDNDYEYEYEYEEEEKNEPKNQ